MRGIFSVDVPRWGKEKDVLFLFVEENDFPGGGGRGFWAVAFARPGKVL